ncbi:hypothetical protein F5Y06DRAFT_76115 [Hypoxylon sp. FL0890]|nr:hypothetical protein F5Y06DRAFT_76115 [Hypoxylon sp. FL0890]
MFSILYCIHFRNIGDCAPLAQTPLEEGEKILNGGLSIMHGCRWSRHCGILRNWADVSLSTRVAAIGQVRDLIEGGRKEMKRMPVLSIMLSIRVVVIVGQDRDFGNSSSIASCTVPT